MQASETTTQLPLYAEGNSPFEAIAAQAAAEQAVTFACYQIANAPLRLYPTPHFHIENIFPATFYAQLLRYFPTGNQLQRMQNSAHGNEEINPQRHYLSYFDRDRRQLPDATALFWDALFKALSRQQFGAVVHAKFRPYLDHLRYGLLGSHHDLLLVSDRTGYDIGPHTDTPQKLFSLLFYCPETADHLTLGTSLFTHKSQPPRQAKRTDALFRYGGDPALDVNGFDTCYTAPYLPNSLFGFVRTRYSYHGVETTGETTPRQLMIYERFATRHSRTLRNTREG